MTDKRELDDRIEAVSRGMYASELVVREIQTVMPHITPEELSQIESVAKASQDRESEMNRLLARVA